MNQYLESLAKFKSIGFNPKERILNTVVNDARKFNRYYIELPKDLEFRTKYPYAIYAGDTYRFGLLHNTLKIKGPLSCTENKSIISSKRFIELTGCFYYPNGVSIIRNDWLKIISKYPNLDTYLYNLSLNSREKYSFEDAKKRFDKYLNSNINYYFENLLEENINSIRFIEDKRYFDVYSVMDGRVPSFKEVILSRQKR